MSKRKPPKHGDKESRDRDAREKLGSKSPNCIFGHAPKPHWLQRHHVAGRKFSDEEIYICHNHHAEVSDSQYDHPTKIIDCINPLEADGHLLLGLGDLLDVVIDELGPHQYREFLTYLRFRLRDIGTRNIVHAAQRPNEDFGESQ